MLQAVLTRVNTYTGLEYRDDPSIFGWELMNEPRCESDPSGKKFNVRFCSHWIYQPNLFVNSPFANVIAMAGMGSRNGFVCEECRQQAPVDSRDGGLLLINQSRLNGRQSKQLLRHTRHRFRCRPRLARNRFRNNPRVSRCMVRP